MHGTEIIHAKLTTISSRLTRSKNIRAKAKTTLEMILRPRKAKANGVASRQHDTVPPSINSSKPQPEEDREEILDDVQDADENMESYDEGSKKDEGLVYAPSETTSETSLEASDNGEDLMELPGAYPDNFLMLLPRELRDKIYGYVLRLDTPLSEYTLRFRCASCPGLPNTANKSTSQSHIYDSRSLLRTSHQIRDEGKQVFFQVNSWRLNRVRLRDTPQAHPLNAIILDTQRLFDRLSQIKAMKHFMHVNMRISLSPLAYCDLPLPDSVALDDPLSIQLFELSQHPSVIAFHKLSETAQCELFRAAFQGLAAHRANVFPSLRSLTLEVSLHANKLASGYSENPLDRCGITFYIRITLGHGDRATPISQNNESLPVSATDSIMPSYVFPQPAKFEVQHQSLRPSDFTHSCMEPFLDQRRHMLSPLTHLLGVRTVEVERRWTVRYCQPGIKDGNMMIHEQPLRQQWQFCTVSEMLERAGPGFDEFLDPRLEYLEISHSDVVEIIENTTVDIEHRLLP